ncbi:apolipoprotein D and lipocalin family protein [Chishuiella changwenlii]|uniref:Apolipoprotein D and lipocalin family protein n=1 Tax=Chishuiella changwenlii TaxID=1434701 RepID=A0A1M7ASK0_9FLAO|nr:lipocalin family protein [Chishuiella changwenlii]GGE91170.1 membrane protein [Chishuiella changwenlii]SHL45655.1 apolipoprotein D and lipocalin family protein [Chishuiella changwenlii]
MNLKKLALAALAIGTTAYIAKHNKKNTKYKPVQNFDLDEFMGRWYEIARIENKSQLKLTNVTHRFILEEEDGSIEIIVRGYDAKKKNWRKIDGIANQDIDNVGLFSTTFLPRLAKKLYVIDYDKDYNNLLIASEDYKLLWILSRRKEISDVVKTRFLESANKVGFDTSKLIWPSQVPISK